MNVTSSPRAMTQTPVDETYGAVADAFASGLPLRLRIEGGGELAIDRPLPFLLVHRVCRERSDAGTDALLLAESSYLLVGPDANHESVSALVRAIAEAGSERFGAFLVLELWAEDGAHDYVVRCPEGEASETTAQLVASLEAVAAEHGGGSVRLEPGEQRAPDDLPQLLSISTCHELGVLYLGLRLPPVYRDPETHASYPVFLRAYRSALSRALRRAAYTFSKVQTDADLNSHVALGTRIVDPSVWQADAELAQVERAFRFLLLVSPTNEEEAWERFRSGGCEHEPTLHYRLLPVDPALLKRRLYAIELERIADPALGFVLQDKRDEVDKQLSMLADRQTANFLHGSRRLFGSTTAELRTTARALLERVQPRRRGIDGSSPVDAIAFVRRAREEIAAYQTDYAGRIAAPQLRPDVMGLMVADGVLLVGRTLSLDPRRVEALIHHEVGTHVLTHANGSAQPLAQLASGLADYDELQEGVAVIGEYLAGGLTANRLRLLAARVLAVASVEEGAGFIDTFRMLRDEWGFSAFGAFNITTRVHQSGGFTRDMIYLRGLISVLALLRDGTPLETLYMGKFAAKHIPILHELRMRGVLRPPPLRPRVLDLPGASERAARLRAGIELYDLAEDAA
jgi:uncharacterized protein (TIGR02421 family)